MYYGRLHLNTIKHDELMPFLQNIERCESLLFIIYISMLPISISCRIGVVTWSTRSTDFQLIATNNTVKIKV